VSDELGMLAQPWKTLPGGAASLDAVVAAAGELKPGRILVGLPRNMDGTYGPAAEAARAFAADLRARVACPVDLWDERLTTVAAQRSLRESGRKARDQRGVVDQVAAQILLQSWLDRAPCDLS
jgi:putative Holliday junction resolvase